MVGQEPTFVEMGQYPASRTSPGRNPHQRSAAPHSLMETSWEQAAVSWRWLDPCRLWSRDLSIGDYRRLRGRLGASLHTHRQWTLRHQPQPDVCRLDLTLSWYCSNHAKRVDGRSASSCGRTHPPGRSARRADVGGGFRGSLRPVQEAGSSISLTPGAERQFVSTLCWNRVF